MATKPLAILVKTSIHVGRGTVARLATPASMDTGLRRYDGGRY